MLKKSWQGIHDTLLNIAIFYLGYVGLLFAQVKGNNYFFN